MLYIVLSFFIFVSSFVPIHSVLAEQATYTGSTTEDRLNRAVSDQHLQLDATRQNTIKTKCQTSQAMLKELQQNTEILVRQRVEVYSNLQKELIAIQLRMTRQGSDASEIDLLNGRIQQELDKFTIMADQYGISLNDLILVDCVQKPEQFQAGLVIMRLKRAQILTVATDLKNTLLSASVSTYEPLKKRLTF